MYYLYLALHLSSINIAQWRRETLANACSTSENLSPGLQ